MRVVAVLAGGAFLAVGAAWVLQRRLIYLPSPGSPAVIAGTTIDEIRYTTTDGLELTGWFVPARAEDSGVTVVVFPGNAGNRAGRVPLATALAARGHSTLLVDYRGYGGNPGTPSEEGLVADARAAVTHLHGRAVDGDRLVYFGESLGAGVATSLARAHPPAALVLRSPFTSLAAIGAYHYPWLPVSLLLRDRFATVETIAQLDVPVLVIAGSEDRIVPPDQSRRVHAAAGGEAQLVVVDGARHNDYALLADEEMVDAVDDFIAAAVPRAG